MPPRNQLRFQPPSTIISPAFWMVLGRKKLEQLRLDDDEIPIWGWYTAGSCRLHITEECLEEGEDRSADLGNMASPSKGTATAMDSHDTASDIADNKDQRQTSMSSWSSLTRDRLKGTLKLFNTMEQFREQLEHRQKLTDTIRTKLIGALESSSMQEYEMGGRFKMLAFADLKKHHYYYHCLYPALTLPLYYAQAEELELSGSELDSEELYLRLGLDAMAIKSRPAPEGAFQPITLVDPTDCSEEGVVGWPLRMILLCHLFFAQRPAQCRHRTGDLDGDKPSDLQTVVCVRGVRRAMRFQSVSTVCPDDLSTVPMTGWERNEQGQMAPRSVDLAPLLDPRVLAREAADLNLKLIRWRLLPGLNLETHANTRILLFGAGTLGCNIIRLLLAWGFRHLTVVDNGRVSLSNPSRQSFFSLADVGASKAETAARRANMEIDPTARIRGHDLTIPMPGHRIVKEETTRMDIERTWSLVKEHDVLLLLTDSRESRWLPTVLGALEGRLVLTVALGFDSYVVMRHGLGDNQLSCYFCADVRGPMDTLSGRTLDQQCTVTRPGVAYLAAGVAVELLASLLQHELGGAAPALGSVSPVESLPDGASLLGVTPHQQRGYVGHLAGLQLTGEAYRHCTACSPGILEAVRQGGIDFILEALQNPGRLPAIARGQQREKGQGNNDIDGSRSAVEEEGVERSGGECETQDEIVTFCLTEDEEGFDEIVS